MGRTRKTARRTDGEEAVPEWLIERYGMRDAVSMYRRLLARWNLVAYNLDPNYPFPVQTEIVKEVLFGTAREIIWFAGNRGGKSKGGAIIDVAMATGIVPLALGGTGFEDRTDPKPPVDIWVSSLTKDFAREVMRPHLEYFIPRDMLQGAWVMRDWVYQLPNGSTIGLKSQEAGADSYMGVSRKLIHMDEEHDEEIHDEALARVMDCDGKLLVTCTPMHGITYTFDRFWVEAGMEPDKSTYIEGCDILRHVQTKNFDRLRVFHSRTEDNPYLPRTAIKDISRRWKDPNVLKVRLGGLHTLIKGSHVFPVEKVQKLRERAYDPIREDREMGLKVYQEPMEGCSYKIGADVGKGKEKGDFSAAVIVEPLQRMVVAKMRSRVDANTFAVRLLEMGHFYNTAEINVERQDFGIVALMELKRMVYPRLWRRRSVGRVLDDMKDEYGFSTDVIGKAQLVSAIRDVLEQESFEIPDKDILDEMGWFIYYDDKVPGERDRHKLLQKCGAMRGKFDDTVIAFGLALMACQTVAVSKPFARTPTVSLDTEYQRALYGNQERRKAGGPVLAHDNRHNFRLRRMGGR